MLRSRYGARLGASSSITFRRSIYLLNLWVAPTNIVIGRWRDSSPRFYRNNPEERNRFVPWLTRELNALFIENTSQVMHLVDIIIDHLPRWHILSTAFRDLLTSCLPNMMYHHFIHEFYNFMRSPYSMLEHDQHIFYSDRPTYLISDHEERSATDNISQPISIYNNPCPRSIIEVNDINSDSSHNSDVILIESPAIEVVNLVDSDSNNESENVELQKVANVTGESDGNEVNREPILTVEIRLKRKRRSREKRSHNKKRPSKSRYSFTRSRTSSTSSDS